VIDGEVQHVAAWEFLYHESLVHVPMAFIPHPTRAMILGGGSLNALREILKYSSLEQVTLAERHTGVIDVMLEANRHLRPLVKHKKLTIIEGDAYSFLLSAHDPYDLIVNDARDLTTRRTGGNVMMRIQRQLTPEGICSDVVYRHLFERKTTQLTLRMLNSLRHKAFGLVFVPEYPGFLHLLTSWGRNVRLGAASSLSVNHDQKIWLAAGQVPCKYYDPRFLLYYVHMPRYVSRFLRRCQKNMRLKLNSREGHSRSS
jgi:spermidine synthase